MCIRDRSITVGCTVGQYLIVWTDIAIIILIINVLIFLEEPFFGHGTPVWQKRLDPIIYQEFCYTGGFISCIGYQRLDSNLFYCLLYTSKVNVIWIYQVDKMSGQGNHNTCKGHLLFPKPSQKPWAEEHGNHNHQRSFNQIHGAVKP